MKRIQSLHSHTLLSDGQITHEESIDFAEKYGISVIAFTEHDVLPDEKTLEKLRKIDTQVKWLIGIEISATPPGIKTSADSGVHIVGLFTDPNNTELLKHCYRAQEERQRRMEEIVRQLNEFGFDLTVQDCLNATTGNAVVLPHIVKALKSKEKNLKLLDEYIEKAKNLSENDLQLKKQFETMLQQGKGQIPYKLFLGNDAFFPVRVEPKYKLNLDEAVRLIRNAGGLAFVAHFTASKKYLDIKALEELMKNNQI